MLVFATEKSVPREYELFSISKWSLLPFYQEEEELTTHCYSSSNGTLFGTDFSKRTLKKF